MNWRGRGPVLIGVAAEIAAILSVIGASHISVAMTGADLPGLGKVAVACASAGAMALFLGAGRLWAGFLALLPAALVAALWVQLPVWVPALLFVLSILLLRNAIVERVPLYLSNKETLNALTRWVPADQKLETIDLGCGLADVSLALARHNSHPQSRFEGIENAPLPFIVAWLRGKLTQDPRISIRWGSLWDLELSQYDMVYAFLSPHPMPRLFEKAQEEMTGDAVLISNSFAVPDQSADIELPVNSGRAKSLLVWHMGKRRHKGSRSQ